MKNLSLKQRAKINGDVTYTTGKTCLHGHKAARFTRNSTCVVCAEIKVRKKRKFKSFDAPICHSGRSGMTIVKKEDGFKEMAARIYKKDQRW